MKRLIEKKIIIGGFGLALFVLTGVNADSNWSTARQVEQNKAIDQPERLQNNLEPVLFTLKDTRKGQSSHIITISTGLGVVLLFGFCHLLVSAIAKNRQTEQALQKTHAELEERAAELVAANEELHNALRQLQVAEEYLLHQNKELESARQQAERSRQRYQDLFDFAPDGYLVTDTTGIIQEANQAATALLGIDQNSLVGQPLSTFVTTQEQTAFHTQLDRLTELLNPVYRCELNLQPQNGESFPGEIRVRGIHNCHEQPIGLHWLIRDITERKQAEETRHALAKEKELKNLQLRFFAMVSHEFRTPISTILLSAQSLEHSYERWPKEKIIKNLGRIQSCAKNMTQLLEDILTINRAESGRLEVNPKSLNLDKFCRDLVEQVQLIDGNKHPITVTIQGQCQEARMDEKLLHSILNNLLLNAIKYSSPGSRILFSLVCENGETIFQICDRGIGILPKDLPHLFNPFHRGENTGNIPGTGLGITVVKKCLDLQGGKISIESEVGCGTTVTVSIPQVQKD